MYTRRVFTLLSVMFGITCYSQTTDVMNFSLKVRSVPVSGSMLTLEMNGFPPNREWLVAVRVQAGARGMLIGDVTLENRQDVRGLRRLSAVSEWPDAAIDIQPSWVKVNTQATRSNLFLYLEVEPGTRLLIRNAGNLVSDSIPTEGAIFMNGEPGPAGAYTFSRAMAYFKNPNARVPRAGDGISRLRNGWIVVDRDNLRKHAIETNLPNFSGLMTPCKCVRSAGFELQIDASGSVKARPLSGDAAVISTILPLLANWRFQPFIVDMQPAIVRSPITIRVTADGGTIW